jgi:hypothetical protein
VKRRRGGTPSQGHVGLVVAANAAHVWMIGGNQSDQVSIARFPRSDFLGFRWPIDPRFPLPATASDLPATFSAASAPQRED